MPRSVTSVHIESAALSPWPAKLLSQEPIPLLSVSEVSRIHYHSNVGGLPQTSEFCLWGGFLGRWRRSAAFGTGGIQSIRADGLRPFVPLAREAVMGSSQPASVTANMVAPLCAFNCYYVHGIWEVALGIENKCTEPLARPNRCPVAFPHSAPVTFCSRKDLSDRAIKKYDLFTKQSIKKSQNDLSLALSHVAVLTGSLTMKQLFLPRDIKAGGPLIKKLTTAPHENREQGQIACLSYV